MQDRCFVIQTNSGYEHLLEALMTKILPEGLYTETFVPKRQLNKRLGGKWRVVTERMFPGYVFVETQNPVDLFNELKNVPRLSKLLHDFNYSFIPLSEKEQEFIERIGKARGDHTFALSKIAFADDTPYKKGDRVQIVEGDLKDFEGEIVDFNLRKRKAIIRTQMFGGRDVEIHVGLEIVRLKDL